MRRMKISICVINKNSEATIEKSLRSVLCQIDESFEIVIVDESSDKSRNIINRLIQEFPGAIKPVFLDKHEMGNIGQARNRSIIEASGDYCIMNIDCDDVWQPHIKDFVAVFLQIEGMFGKKFLLAGQQINMARRDFLISVGPYQPIEHGEDRDLWMRLAKRDQYMPIDHVLFFSRLPLTTKVNKMKAIKRTFWSVRDEIRAGRKFSALALDFFLSEHPHPRKIRAIKILSFPIAKLTSRGMSKFDQELYFNDATEWNMYKTSRTGTYREIAKVWGFSGSLEFLQNSLSRSIFEHGREDRTYQELLKSGSDLASGKKMATFDGTEII